MADDKFSICPRCDSATTEVVFRSPVEGVWELYSCTTCKFMFRSSEPESMTDPNKYDPTFKIKPEDLPNAPVMPAIPPLKTK